MAVAAAKGELFATAQAGDVCVVNADDPLVMALPVPSGVRMVNHQIFCNPQILAGILPTSQGLHVKLCLLLFLSYNISELHVQPGPFLSDHEAQNECGLVFGRSICSILERS